MSDLKIMPYSKQLSELGLRLIYKDADGSNQCPSPCIAVSVPPGLKKPSPAVVICPGGGYGFLANDHEGLQVAQWFNARGIAAFILHYRLGTEYHHPAQLEDAEWAMGLIRVRAAEWGIDKSCIGIMGFSAGGHFAAAAASQLAGKPMLRPDFLVLGYPVITLTSPFTHEGSRDNLLGTEPASGLVESLSAENLVTPATPPAFIFHTTDDNVVPVENAIMFYSALRKAGVPAELHIYNHGSHGVGLTLHDPILGTWPQLLEGWLRSRNILPK